MEQELGEDFQQVHEVWLNKIGNLTLTGRNSELSNRPFKEKRDMVPEGFRHSPLFLNESLARADGWNQMTITERGFALARRACEIWVYLEG